MNPHTATTTASDAHAAARAARQAALRLATLPLETRNGALLAAADSLLEHRDAILAANATDCAAARSLVDSGRMTASTFARLQTSAKGISEMATRLREVAALPDPLGRILSSTELDTG